MPMIKYLVDGYTMPLFFCFLSIVLILLTFRKKEYFAIIPVLSLVAFTFYIYASVLSNQEYESSARYLSHGMLSLYYLGGIGLEKIMNIGLRKI
jgi:c-di-AMP phosphodiesterase-like protein